MLTEWDLRKVLDTDRHSLHNGRGDWLHMNGVWYSEIDDCVIISAKNQGLIKVNRQNELKWILAPHVGWGNAGENGNGPATTPFLLTPVDDAGIQLSEGVINGTLGNDDFDWAWGQHAPRLLPNGNLLVFDNGFNRNFNVGVPNWSRIVEYKIDESNLEVRQIEQYGKERGVELYSKIISFADFLPETGNRIMSPGIIRENGDPHAKVIEMSWPEKDVVFEANILFKNELGAGNNSWGEIDLVYRSEKWSLYPKE